MKPFIHDDFLLETRDGPRPLPPGREGPADHRLPLPPAARPHRRGPPLPLDHRDLARRRPLQVAGDARRTASPSGSAPGDASDWEKFEAWARTVPGHAAATRSTTGRTWSCAGRSGSRRSSRPPPRRRSSTRCNERLAEAGFTAQGLLDAVPRGGGVHAPTTRSTPSSTTPRSPRRPDADTQVYPTWRPDKAVARRRPRGLERRGSAGWRGRRAARSATCDALLDALEKRHAFFHERGCRASDHGLETIVRRAYTDAEAAAALRPGSGRARPLDPAAARGFRSALLHRPRAHGPRARLGAAVPPRRHAQQQHAHAAAPRPRHRLRLDRRLRAWRGRSPASSTASTRPSQLAKTILYNLNPRDNELMATMIGNFQDGSVPGKMQFGLGLVVPRPDRRDGGPDARRSRTWACCRASSACSPTRAASCPTRATTTSGGCSATCSARTCGGAGCPTTARPSGRLVANVCFHNARDYFGFGLGRAAGEHAKAPRPTVVVYSTRNQSKSACAGAVAPRAKGRRARPWPRPRLPSPEGLAERLEARLRRLELKRPMAPSSTLSRSCPGANRAARSRLLPSPGVAFRHRGTPAALVPPVDADGRRSHDPSPRGRRGPPAALRGRPTWSRCTPVP